MFDYKYLHKFSSCTNASYLNTTILKDDHIRYFLLFKSLKVENISAKDFGNMFKRY